MRSLDDLPRATPGSTWHLCPVDDCDWSHCEPPTWEIGRIDSVEHVAEVLSHADPGLREWNDVVSSAVANVTLANAKRMEGIVSEHFATHTEVDFLRTINRLRGLLAEHGIES